MILADKITEERKKNGWSQEELAARLGVSRQAVSKWESAGSTPDLQKVLQMAELFCVSTDYLLKDELAPELPQTPDTPSGSTAALYTVSMEEANEYLTLKKESAPVIANAVTLCILSPAALLILGALSEEPRFHITEGLAAGVGCTVLFGMIAAAVFLFITCGIRLSRMKHVADEPFETAYGVTGMAKEKKRAYEGTFTKGVAGGVVLCIVAAVPVILAGAMEAPDSVCAIFVAVLLLLVAIGVNSIVRVCIIKSSYDSLLQQGDYTPAEKRFKQMLHPFVGAYWCIAAAIYLGWSFWTDRWNFTWLVWPVAGVLFAAACAILRMLLKQDT